MFELLGREFAEQLREVPYRFWRWICSILDLHQDRKHPLVPGKSRLGHYHKKASSQLLNRGFTKVLICLEIGVRAVQFLLGSELLTQEGSQADFRWVSHLGYGRMRPIWALVSLQKQSQSLDLENSQFLEVKTWAEDHSLNHFMIFNCDNGRTF